MLKKGKEEMSKKFETNSIIYNDDIEIIGQEKLNSSPVLRMNINSRMFGSLLSTLENIHNTLIDEEDMPTKQVDIHSYESLDGKKPTLKEDVLSALNFVRHMDDVIHPITFKYFYPNEEKEPEYIRCIRLYNEKLNSSYLAHETIKHHIKSIPNQKKGKLN